MGMFCKFGLFELKRPVAATAWEKVVWIRLVFWFTSFGKAST
jgi:hypothetical protein